MNVTNPNSRQVRISHESLAYFDVVFSSGIALMNFVSPAEIGILYVTFETTPMY